MSQEFVKELSILVQSGWRAISCQSFEEERALRVLERVASHHKRQLFTWSVASGFTPGGDGAGSLEDGLRTIASRDEPALFVLLDAHSELRDPRTVRRLRDLLAQLGERRQCVVFLGPPFDPPMELTRELAQVEMPLPRADELEKLFQKVAEQLDAGMELDLEPAVRAALGLTGTEAVRVLRKAFCQTGGFDENTADWIVKEKRHALQRVPSLSLCDTTAGMGEVGGLGELKRWLSERRRAFGAEARKFGLPTPQGLLLLGVQGCGKSLCAKAVAREWQFPLLHLDLATVFAGGERSPEAAIREATSVAASIAPAVLWIDEIEKGFAGSQQDSATSRVFGSFLTWLSEKTAPVFVVATANDVANLPPELLRRGRFDELFFVDLPSQIERTEILAIHLTKRGRDPKQFQLESLAAEAERLSGAEIEQVVAAALYTAFAENRDLADNDLANAISETVPLYDTYEDRIKELRDWSRNRARPASVDVRMADLFNGA
jgi:SpoVK/Ycf46/Vps4 family AAA+-type ATPase